MRVPAASGAPPGPAPHPWQCWIVVCVATGVNGGLILRLPPPCPRCPSSLAHACVCAHVFAGGNVALARSKAAAKRQSTLLVEWQDAQKANTFSDNRIGEKGMSTEDKLFARFRRQQTRNVVRKKSGKFTLDEDGPGDGGDYIGDDLTHRGKKLSEVDYTEDRLDGVSDEEDDGRKGAQPHALAPLSVQRCMCAVSAVR